MASNLNLFRCYSRWIFRARKALFTRPHLDQSWSSMVRSSKLKCFPTIFLRTCRLLKQRKKWLKLSVKANLLKFSIIFGSVNKLNRFLTYMKKFHGKWIIQQIFGGREIKTRPTKALTLVNLITIFSKIYWNLFGWQHSQLHGLVFVSRVLVNDFQCSRPAFICSLWQLYFDRVGPGL